MTTNRNLYNSVVAVLALILTIGFFTGCGKKGQKEFEQGQAAYVAQDYKTAVSQFALAANKGHAEAQYRVGLCYAEGKGVEEDINEAIKWFKQAAEKGNVDAMYLVGNSYRFGAEKTGFNMIDAFKWYQKAAKGGNQEAKALIESMKEVNETLKAAEKGDSEAMFELGEWYSKKEAEQDQTEAFKWYLTAANQGHAYAQYRIGYCYAQGEGVEENDYEAVKWYQKAADQGHYGAMDMLALHYRIGSGVREDEAEAEKWSKLAEEARNKSFVDAEIKGAKNGNVDAMTSLGLRYRNGDGVKEDKAEAFKWFNKAAEKGNAVAMFNLGLCYEEGEGVKKDEVEAVKLYRQAAEAGIPGAMERLSTCYLIGIGVESDEEESNKWTERYFQAIGI